MGLAGSGEDTTKKGPESPLASQSVLLLLVLANHCTADRNIRNPYRQALLHAQNFHGMCIQSLLIKNIRIHRESCYSKAFAKQFGNKECTV